MLFNGDYPSAAFIRSNSSNSFRRRFSMSEGFLFKASYDGLVNGFPLSFRDIPCPPLYVFFVSTALYVFFVSAKFAYDRGRKEGNGEWIYTSPYLS